MPAVRHCSLNEFFDLLRETLAREECWGMSLSQPRAALRGTTPDVPRKLVVRPIELSGKRRYQLAERRGAQEFHQNLTADELQTRCQRELRDRFDQADLMTPTADFSVRVVGNETVRLTQRKPSRQAPSLQHDRQKSYLIPEGTPCPFLAEIGVMTTSGQVKPSMQAKFRQVNRFLEFVDDVLLELPALDVLRVIDFGCGKSYLTFALHFLLSELRGRDVEIIGLDLKSEVVRDCQRIAEKLQCQGLRFEVGDIAGYSANGPVDLMVSLHACDTATDAAIAQAVRWNAKVILAVPCCQHELFGSIPDDVLPGLLRHGVLKERFAALATDALRAAWLETVGYRTQVVEFIDLEHTPKNLLIRAIRSGTAPPSAQERFELLKTQLGLKSFSLEQHFGSDMT